MNDPQQCLCCAATEVKVLVDFGPQPPSNRFEQAGVAEAVLNPLVVGQCLECGLLQLLQPMAPAVAKSRFEWLTYNEPESHLDDLVNRLSRLPDITIASRIAALTYKDDTTLARFNRLGFSDTYRYDLRSDFGLDDPCAGLESIQDAMRPPLAAALASKHGLADLLLVRHVLEHAHDPATFMRSIAALVKPGGYMLFEMPDCEKFVRACDYCFIWEEHITYFSRPSLAAFVAHAGFDLVETLLYPYPLEDSLIGIVRNAPPRAGAAVIAPEALAGLVAEGDAFGRRFASTRSGLQALFSRWTAGGRQASVFGAGHLAAKFINIYGLEPFISCVIDDNPHKQSLLMPGSRLPIRGSAALSDPTMGTCLLSLNPESEQKVRAKNQSFLDQGGEFQSVFALSPSSVYREIKR